MLDKRESDIPIILDFVLNISLYIFCYLILFPEYHQSCCFSKKNSIFLVFYTDIFQSLIFHLKDLFLNLKYRLKANPFALHN